VGEALSCGRVVVRKDLRVAAPDPDGVDTVGVPVPGERTIVRAAIGEAAGGGEEIGVGHA
jgi:hypothetical protein